MSGRPQKYNQEVANNICDLISTSANGLRKICTDNNVSYTTVKRWLQENLEFRAQYELAKQEQADVLADEMLEIADNKEDDMVDTEYGKTGNSTNVQRCRLQVDTRKWIASKLKPKKYGDKIDVTTDGEKLNTNKETFITLSNGTKIPL